MINIILPDNSDNRVLQLQEVTASPSGEFVILNSTVILTIIILTFIIYREHL